MSNVTSTMSSPKCPNCLRNYSFSQAGLQPRILSCRHSLCKQCIVKLSRAKKDGVTCPKCKANTPIPKADKGLQSLPVNLFLVGLACTTVKQQINPFNHHLEFKPKPKDGDASTELKGGRPPCVSCNTSAAESLCQQCNVNLCDPCFATIHSNQASKTHAKISLLTDKVFGCTKHENLPREYFCQDDKELICAKCGLMGEHKGHDILHIQEINTDILKEVEPAMSSAKDTLKKLYHSKQAAEEEESRLSKDKQVLNDQLEEEFAALSAGLQLRFLAVQSSCMSESDAKMKNLCRIKANLESNICRLTTVMEDVQSWLEDKSKAPSNLMEVVSVLRGASELPWYLTEGAKGDIKIPPTSISEIPKAVELDKSVLHTLKSSAELPEDFEPPVIDDSILKQNPLFSAKKQQKKKRPIGPDHVRILQKEGILPADLTEVRQPVPPDPKTDTKKLNKKKQFVNVVHIKNPACFIIHRQSDGARLSRMMRSLTNICESIDDFSKHIPDPIQVGTKCCCKFDDGQWYRCLVRKVPDDVAGVLSMASPADMIQAKDEDELKVEVVYIDYGNTQWVPVTKLVKLKPKFEKEPTFAVTCALYDIIPPEQKTSWPRESSEAFATMVATQDVPLMMSVHGEVGDTLSVDLHQSPNSSVEDDAPVSIRDALIFLELACFVNDTPSPKSPKPFQSKRYFPAELPCCGDTLGVTICNIISPHHFYVHELGVMESSLNKMMGELQEAYRKRDRTDWAILCPQPGMICVAKYTNDKKWYRAKITALSGKQQVEVLYVDYGNTAIISVTLIRKITEQFLKLPTMAIPCKLVDIVPKGPEGEPWGEEANFFFSNNISYKNVEINIYDDKTDNMSVVAFVVNPDDRQNVNALMVQSGHAISSGPASFVPEMLRPSSTASASPKTATTTKPATKPATHCEPSSARKKVMYTAVHVSHVESPSCIYLQLATASKDGLDSLLEAMTLHYKDTEADMDHDWSEGDPCAALLAREGVWCRGEIVAFLPENNLVVLFTDYGNKEILSLENIRALSESFRAEPPFAICCHLTGIIPAGGKDWTQTASQFLQEKLSDLDCYISQKGEKESTSLPVDLLYELTGQEMIDRKTDDELDSISKLLINEGLALRDRSKAKSKKATAEKKIAEKVPDSLSSHTEVKDGAVGEAEELSPSTKETVADPLPPGSESILVHDVIYAVECNGDVSSKSDDAAGTVAPSPYEGTSVDAPPSLPLRNGDQGSQGARDQSSVEKDSVLDTQRDITVKLSESQAKEGSEQIVETEASVGASKERELVVPKLVETVTEGSLGGLKGDVDVPEELPTAAAETAIRVMRSWADQMDEQNSSISHAVPTEVLGTAGSVPKSPPRGRPKLALSSALESSLRGGPNLGELQTTAEETSSRVKKSLADQMDVENSSISHTLPIEVLGTSGSVPESPLGGGPKFPSRGGLKSPSRGGPTPGEVRTVTAEASSRADKMDEENSSISHALPIEILNTAGRGGPNSPSIIGPKPAPAPVEPQLPPRPQEDLVLPEYLPSLPLPVGERHVMAVSFVSQEGLIYGIDVEKLSLLNPLMDNLQRFCQSRVPPTVPMRVNQAVCAKFNLDNKWYRATVRSVHKDTIEVMYIDFGNSEVVCLGDVDVRPFRIDLPGLSLCCELHRFTNITAEKCILLAQIITEQTCTVVVKTCEVGKPIVVDMFLLTGENVADLLVTVAMGQYPPTPEVNRRPPDGGSPEEIFDEDDDFVDSGESSQVSLKGDPYSNRPPLAYGNEGMAPTPGGDHYIPLPSRYQLLQFPLGGKEFLAEVPCIKTPNMVYLQYSTTFTDGPYQDHNMMALYEQFKDLHAEVNKMALSLPEITYPRQGMPCLAYYQNDKQWYRGEIISVINGPVLYCNVRFVDYGTIERLPIDRIYQLPEKYLELPTQCRLCQLQGLQPPAKIPAGFPVAHDTKWPVPSTNAMVELIKNKIFLATIMEDGPVPTISLYSCEFSQGDILRGPPMFMSLIETGLADIGLGINEYSRSEPPPTYHPGMRPAAQSFVGY